MKYIRFILLTVLLPCCFTAKAQTWKPIEHPGGTAMCIIMDPHRDGVIYAAYMGVIAGTSDGGAGYMNLTTQHTVPVDIEVYDLLGRLVTRVRSGVLAAGSHMFTLNVPSGTGIYMLRVSTPHEQFSKSFVVLK